VRLSQVQKLAAYEAEQVAQQVRAAQAVFEATAGTTEQARRAYAIAELRFQEGVSTQLELSDARLSLAQAEINRARAARDLRVARMRRALLPQLPTVMASASSGLEPLQATSIPAAASTMPVSGGPAPAAGAAGSTPAAAARPGF
jgi:hypothetical protein